MDGDISWLVQGYPPVITCGWRENPQIEWSSEGKLMGTTTTVGDLVRWEFLVGLNGGSPQGSFKLGDMIGPSIMVFFVGDVLLEWLKSSQSYPVVNEGNGGRNYGCIRIPHWMVSRSYEFSFPPA